MQRIFVTSTVLLFTFGMGIPPALADLPLTATVTLYDSYGDASGAGHGGEFLAVSSGFDFTPASLGEVADRFEVFCMERDEFIEFGTTYYVDFNTAAVDGGAGGPSPDPLSYETAFVYTQFMTHNLTGYDYDNTGPGRVESANALQNVIWFFEEELEGNPYTWGLDPIMEAPLADMFYGAAMDSNWNSIGSVQVMNLYRDAYAIDNRQDQLVMVPAPAAFLLGAFGLGMVGWVRSRSDRRGAHRRDGSPT